MKYLDNGRTMTTEESNISSCWRMVCVSAKEGDVPPGAGLLSIKNLIQMTADCPLQLRSRLVKLSQTWNNNKNWVELNFDKILDSKFILDWLREGLQKKKLIESSILPWINQVNQIADLNDLWSDLDLGLWHYDKILDSKFIDDLFYHFALGLMIEEWLLDLRLWHYDNIKMKS